MKCECSPYSWALWLFAHTCRYEIQESGPRLYKPSSGAVKGALVEVKPPFLRLGMCRIGLE